MKADILYRIISLELRGTKLRVGFNGALIDHHSSGRQAEIRNFKTPLGKVEDYLAKVGHHEVSTIRYQIIAADLHNHRRLSPAVAFCHPFPRGTGVRLVLTKGRLFLVRDGNRKFFSDNFWLAERLNDQTLPRQSVYQFHE